MTAAIYYILGAILCIVLAVLLILLSIWIIIQNLPSVKEREDDGHGR